MELWEFNACVKAWNLRRKAENKNALVQCWQTAALVGQAFGGKLKRLSHYVKDDDEVIKAPPVTPEQMAAMDERFKKIGGGDDVA